MTSGGAGERAICLSGQYPEPAPLFLRLRRFRRRLVSERAGLERAAPQFPIWPCTRWGFPCLKTYALSGGLLPHLFTLTRARAEIRQNPGGIFSVALSVGTPRGIASRVYLGVMPQVTRHRALWCSDFPPRTRARSGSPPFQNLLNYSSTPPRMTRTAIGRIASYESYQSYQSSAATHLECDPRSGAQD